MSNAEWLRGGSAVVLVALVYFLSAVAGNSLTLTGSVDAVWPPAGVGMAAIYLGGLRLLPGVLVGDILADVVARTPVGASAGQTFGNMLEVTVAALLLRRFSRTESLLDTVEGIGRLLAAVAAGVAISATIGSLSLLANGVIAHHEWPSVWRTWFIGDTCGALLVVPLALAWIPTGRPFLSLAGRYRELATMLAAALILTEVGLRLEESEPILYIVFPALIWAALRFGARGATVAVLVTVMTTIWETAHKTGAFFQIRSITNEVLSIQLYIAVATVSTLVLVAVVSERERFAQRLGASRARIVEAGDAERRRLERDLHDGAQQRLSALSGRVGSFNRRPYVTHDERVDILDHVGSELTIAIEELRELAHGIHPAVLTDFGLARAVTSMAARGDGSIRLHVDLPAQRLGALVESTAYYVVAESLANAQRYSHGTWIHVQLGIVQGALHVVVADNGVGGAAASAGSGLGGLRDRVESAGGRFRVVSEPGRGTHIHAAIPFA